MAITALLDLRITPELVSAAYEVIDEVLATTRAFAGNLGVDVVTDVTDPTHILLIEHWASLEADDAYRAFRAGAGKSNLGSILASPPILTRFSD